MHRAPLQKPQPVVHRLQPVWQGAAPAQAEAGEEEREAAPLRNGPRRRFGRRCCRLPSTLHGLVLASESNSCLGKAQGAAEYG